VGYEWLPYALARFDYMIVGARDLTADERAVFAEWEAQE
jgi:hypothetical protein